MVHKQKKTSSISLDEVWLPSSPEEMEAEEKGEDWRKTDDEEEKEEEM